MQRLVIWGTIVGLVLLVAGCGGGPSSSPPPNSSPASGSSPGTSQSTPSTPSLATSVTIQFGTSWDQSTYSVPNPLTTVTKTPVYIVVTAPSGTVFPNGTTVQFASGSASGADVLAQFPHVETGDALEVTPTSAQVADPGSYNVVVTGPSGEILGSSTFTYTPTFTGSALNVTTVPSAVASFLQFVPDTSADYGPDSLGVQIEQLMGQCAYIGSNTYPGSLTASAGQLGAITITWTVPFDSSTWASSGQAPYFTRTTTFVWSISQDGQYVTPENAAANDLLSTIGDPGTCPGS